MLARSETIFELPSFKESITCRRCLVMVDGFYEHHHRNGKTYPFFIQKENKDPLFLAGIYDSATIDGNYWRPTKFQIVHKVCLTVLKRYFLPNLKNYPLLLLGSLSSGEFIFF